MINQTSSDEWEADREARLIAWRRVIADNEREPGFNAIKAFKRGTFRCERGEDTVVIAHCHTYNENGIDFTSWYVAIYTNSRLVIRREFYDSELTYAVLDTFITGVLSGEDHQ